MDIQLSSRAFDTVRRQDVYSLFNPQASFLLTACLQFHESFDLTHTKNVNGPAPVKVKVERTNN